MSDPTTSTNRQRLGTIEVVGSLVTAAGFLLAWIVWVNAGEVTGHTVALTLPFIGTAFSLAYVLPVLSEGFVLMAVRIANARETSESTRSFARKSIFGAIVVMSIVGLIVNTNLSEIAFFKHIISGIIGGLTPVALLLGWTLRSRYAEDRARYEERRASATRPRRSSAPSATTVTSSKPNNSASGATRATASSEPVAPASSASSTSGDHLQGTVETASVSEPTAPETTAPIDIVDRAAPKPTGPRTPERSLDEVDTGIRSIEHYLTEQSGKTDQADAYVRWLIVAQGRDLDGIKGSEIQEATSAGGALARRIVKEFKDGVREVTDADKLRFGPDGNLSQRDSADPTTTAVPNTAN